MEWDCLCLSQSIPHKEIFEPQPRNFGWLDIILLCGFKNTQNTSYTEATRASENVFLIFNISFTKNQELVWLGSIAKLNQIQSMDWVQFSLIEFS